MESTQKITDNRVQTLSSKCSNPEPAMTNAELSHKKVVDKKTTFFKGDQNVLSPWAPCVISYKDKTFTSVEQAFSYHLLQDTDKQLAEEILKITNPKEIKHVTDSYSWEKARSSMKEINVIKFNDQQLQKQLISTYPHELVHNIANSYWGSGITGNGQNNMGKILMEIRSKLMTNNKKTDSLNNPTTAESKNATGTS